MDNKTAIRVFFSALLAMVFWGLSFIWTSIVLEYYPPITTIFLRLVLSSAFLFIVLSLFGRLQKIRRRHLLLFIASAFFNPFLYFIGENYGVKLTTPTMTAIMIATIPLFTPVAAWFMIRERLSLLNFIGILLSFSGIAVMLINPDLSFSLSSGGILFLLLAVFSAIVYSVLLKKLTIHYKASSIVAWQNLIGVFLFLPVFLFSELDHFREVVPDQRLISALVSLAIFASSLAFIFFTYAIKYLGVNRANVYSNLIPVITAITSYFVLDEIFTLSKITGMTVVITGVFITQLKTKQLRHEQI